MGGGRAGEKKHGWDLDRREIIEGEDFRNVFSKEVLVVSSKDMG